MIRASALFNWLRPDLDKRPQEPKPAPVLYDWQQDRDVITDLKLWNVFTVQIDPNITAGYVAVHAEKPKQGERIVPREPLEERNPDVLRKKLRELEQVLADLKRTDAVAKERVDVVEDLLTPKAAEPYPGYYEDEGACRPDLPRTWVPGAHVTGQRGGWEGSD